MAFSCPICGAHLDDTTEARQLHGDWHEKIDSNMAVIIEQYLWDASADPQPGDN